MNLFQVNYPLTKRMSLERKGNFAPSREPELVSAFSTWSQFVCRPENVRRKRWMTLSTHPESIDWNSFFETWRRSLGEILCRTCPKITFSFRRPSPFQSTENRYWLSILVESFPLESVWVHVWETSNPCGTHTWLQWLWLWNISCFTFFSPRFEIFCVQTSFETKTSCCELNAWCRENRT